MTRTRNLQEGLVGNKGNMSYDTFWDLVGKKGICFSEIGILFPFFPTTVSQEMNKWNLLVDGMIMTFRVNPETRQSSLPVF